MTTARPRSWLLCLLVLSSCGRLLGIHETNVHTVDAGGDASVDGGASSGLGGRGAGGAGLGIDGGGAGKVGVGGAGGVLGGSIEGGTPSPDDARGPADDHVPPTGESPMDGLGMSSIDVAAPDDTGMGSPPDARPPAIDLPSDHVPPTIDVGPPVCSPTTLPATVSLAAPSTAGACSLAAGAVPTLFAAVDSELFANSGGCGGCIEVENSHGRVMVQVVDRAGGDGGPAGNTMSISRAALDLISSPTTYSIPARWRWIPCTAPRFISATLQAGRSDYSWAVTFAGHTNRLAKVEYLSFGVWKKLERLNYNFFREPAATGLPDQFRLSDVHGNAVTTGSVTWPKNQTAVVTLGVQFPPPCTL